MNFSQKRLEENLKDIIASTQDKLNNNTDWKKKYADYANLMLQYKDKKEELSRNFRKWKPFTYYITVGKAKTAPQSLHVFARYLGQTVANINVNSKNVTISTDKNLEDRNRDNFNWDKPLNSEPWTGDSAKEFRAYFNKVSPDRINLHRHNDEHKLESMLLTEFSNAQSINKKLCGIQPIKFAGYRLSMPVNVKGSNIKNGINNIELGDGHIDILARKKGNRPGDTQLVVFEVKDENKESSSETIENVLLQGTGYAVFLSNLLHSECGDAWYKLLGFGRKVPEKLTIKVCSAMPNKDNGNSDKFDIFTLPCGQDTFEYNWLYVDDDGRKITNLETTLKSN